jgi:hypothetical protein
MGTIVFDLWFEREYADRNDTCLHVGIYSSEAAAHAAIARLSDKPGFREYPAGFTTYPREIDRDGWTEGFISITETGLREKALSLGDELETDPSPTIYPIKSSCSSRTMIGPMLNDPRRIFLFRCERVASGKGTVMCVAPADLVASVYGGGGHGDQEGLQRAFGGYALYRCDASGESFIGVWGARNASRFRTALRRKAAITVINEPPPARLVAWSKTDRRPHTAAQRGLA